MTDSRNQPDRPDGSRHARLNAAAERPTPGSTVRSCRMKPIRTGTQAENPTERSPSESRKTGAHTESPTETKPERKPEQTMSPARTKARPNRSSNREPVRTDAQADDPNRSNLGPTAVRTQGGSTPRPTQGPEGKGIPPSAAEGSTARACRLPRRLRPRTRNALDLDDGRRRVDETETASDHRGGSATEAGNGRLVFGDLVFG